MSESTATSSNACPACKQKILGREFLSSPAAPLYFRCKHCKAKLRMKRVASFYLAMIWMLVGGLLMLFMGMLVSGLFVPNLHFLVRAGIGLALASALVIYIAVQFPLQEYRLMKCGEQLAGQSSEGGYRLLGIVGFLLFSASIGVGGMWIIFNNDDIVQRLSAGTRSYGKMDEKWTVYGLKDGLSKRAHQLKGKVLFINFWESWCVPCQQEMPSIVNLYKTFENDPNIEFLIVSSEPRRNTQAAVESRKWKLPFYFTVGAKPDVFQTSGIPATFFVDGRGDVVFKYVGAKDWDTDEVRGRLRKLIEEGKQ